MQDILSTIVTRKREQLAAEKRIVPTEQMREQAFACAEQRKQLSGGMSSECKSFCSESSECKPFHSMRQALEQSATGIIAEFKRRSPSKGWIKQEADPSVIPPAYERAGASALSILTDEPFFGCCLDDLRTARRMTNLPLLRKEFIVDAYQVEQAVVAGADAVLLIAACLRVEEAEALSSHAHRLGLEVLLEVHSANELCYLSCRPDMLGVNNRHLGSFVTDVNHSFRLAEQLPSDGPLLVSESGISRPDTICRLRQAGFRGFLIGETFMKTPSPADALREMIQAVEKGFSAI